MKSHIALDMLPSVSILRSKTGNLHGGKMALRIARADRKHAKGFTGLGCASDCFYGFG